MGMRLTLHGTRGSLPAPGAGTVRYGGNTSCVTVLNDEGHALVLDAGSGIRRAGDCLPSSLERVDILLTHLHMDHIQGLGFFRQLYTPGVDVHIWGPPSVKQSLRARLTRYLSPPLFPVRMREVPSRITCHDVTQQSFEIQGYRVSAHLITHPGPTLGFRVQHGGRTLAYLPDHEPQLGCRKGLPHQEWLSGFDIAEGADLLLHDSQYTAEEYTARVGWGHCTPGLAARYAEKVGARRLLFFHHDPTRDDEALEAHCSLASDSHEGDITMSPAAELDTHEV